MKSLLPLLLAAHVSLAFAATAPAPAARPNILFIFDPLGR